MNNKKIVKALVITGALTAMLFNACAPLREFGSSPGYEGDNHFAYHPPAFDSSKKTVVIVANNNGTELFDMMAPYYLFNATGKANVYIVAKNKYPIVVKKGFYLLPQSTFSEMDSMRMQPDVMVIPFLNAADSAQQDPAIVKWIQQHYSPSVQVLSVCDGAATAAATGLYDGKLLTAHASDYDGIKVHFSRPLWVQHTSVASSGNLHSAAGVSNAAEGSLQVIDQLFGAATLKKVMGNIHYPYDSLKLAHQSTTFKFADKVCIGKKIMFSHNKKIGVFMHNGINEFDLAAITDTYNRTFPGSIQSFAENDQPIQTKYGLTLIPTGKVAGAQLDEVHVLDTRSFSNTHQVLFPSAQVVVYPIDQQDYIINHCLQRIAGQYGRDFEHTVKLMLDYN